ncbi:MAG: hypothetical protein CMJ87_06110 [Planctomycetes bacterium]|nr:hypothetical protein [Planctomycetota bacterium]
MKVTVTGAAGVLGSGIVREVAAAGHTVQAVDLLPLPAEVAETPGVEARQAHLADAAQARAAVADSEVVIHCAAVHPWKPYTDSQYWDLNVKSTHHVLAGCVAAGVQRVVFTSSVGPWAPFGRETLDLPLREDVPPQPRDLYALTKWVGEEIAQWFWRVHRLRTLVLRPVACMPLGDTWREGVALLSGAWMHRADVIRAHALAMEVDVPLEGVEACFLGPAVPYTPDEVIGARRSLDAALAVYEQHFPGVAALLQKRGVAPPRLAVVYSIERAHHLLNWQPHHTFAAWYAAHCDEPVPGTA